MITTEAFARPEPGDPWTLADLRRLPDDDLRYEILDGNLVVSPMQTMPHYRAATLLRERLRAQGPDDVVSVQRVGIAIDRHHRRTTLLVADLTIIHLSALDGDDVALRPRDVIAVVEILAPDSGSYEAVVKRHHYARAGIRHYWIVDPERRTLTVLRHDGDAGYEEVEVVKPGTAWRTDDPFPLALDPADFT